MVDGLVAEVEREAPRPTRRRRISPTRAGGAGVSGTCARTAGGRPLRSLGHFRDPRGVTAARVGRAKAPAAPGRHPLYSPAVADRRRRGSGKESAHDTRRKTCPRAPPNDPSRPTTRRGAPRWRRLREPALIGLLALTLNLAGNGRVGLWDRDEPRYAACTREMRPAGRLALPHVQRRAPLSQADPDLLADAGRVRPWAATIRSGRGWSRRWPGRRPAWSSGGSGARCSAPGAGLLAALVLATVADHGHRVEAGDHRRDARSADRRRPGLPLGAGRSRFEEAGGRRSGSRLALATS